jgi:serine/threonine protein kinase
MNCNASTLSRIDYKTEEKLGQGNFSEVYRVVHRMSGKRYAIKRSRRPIQSLADKNMWLAVSAVLSSNHTCYLLPSLHTKVVGCEFVQLPNHALYRRFKRWQQLRAIPTL